MGRSDQATVKFRAKVETIRFVDGTLAYECVKVPAVGSRHCNMAAFRAHRNIGSFANSTLFPGILKGVLTRMGIKVGGCIRLDEIPDGVEVDTSKFLASVTITVGDDATWRGDRSAN